MHIMIIIKQYTPKKSINFPEKNYINVTISCKNNVNKGKEVQEACFNIFLK